MKISFLEMLCFVAVLLIGLALGWYLAQLLPYLPSVEVTPTPAQPVRMITMVRNIPSMFEMELVIL